MDAIEQTIQQFILNNFLFTSDQGSLTSDTSFLERGFVDSTGVLEIVGFLEETFRIKVEDDEITPENLDSIRKLGAFVRKKNGVAPAARG